MGSAATGFATGPTLNAHRLYGVRWDYNPAIGKVNKAIKAWFGTRKYLAIGPGGLVSVPVGPLKVALSIIDTHIQFDLLAGQDQAGQWAGFARFAVGIGQEGNFVDVAEDILSTFFPAFNLVPTPVAWADQTVPYNQFHAYFNHVAWSGFTAAFSDAPTSGTPTFGALLEGFCIIRLTP